MLRINLKRTIKYHKSFILCIILLMVFSVFACNIAVFRFNDIRQDELMNLEGASEFIVETDASYNHIYPIIKSTIEKNKENLESVYITLSGFPIVRSYFWGNDVLSNGNAISDDSFAVIGYISASRGKSIGDSINIFDHEYTICGIRAMRDYDEIFPTNDLEQLNISSICFRWNHIPTEKKANNFEKHLHDEFENCKITTPTHNGLLTGIFSEIKTTLFIACIALFNIIFLFRYLIGVNSATYSVFFVCGASPIRISISAIAELMIYSIVGNIIGDCLFVLLLLNKQTAAQDFLWQGLGISAVFCTMVGLVISIPYLLYVFKKNILREGEIDV